MAHAVAPVVCNKEGKMRAGIKCGGGGGGGGRSAMPPTECLRGLVSSAAPRRQTKRAPRRQTKRAPRCPTGKFLHIFDDDTLKMPRDFDENVSRSFDEAVVIPNLEFILQYLRATRCVTSPSVTTDVSCLLLPDGTLPTLRLRDSGWWDRLRGYADDCVRNGSLDKEILTVRELLKQYRAGKRPY